MKIQVKYVERKCENQVFIHFHCGQGLGYGLWHGKSIEQGSEVDVELEIAKPISADKILFCVDALEERISFEGQCNIITAKLLEVDSGLVLNLNGGIIFCDVIGEIAFDIPSFVRIECAELHVYETNI